MTPFRTSAALSRVAWARWWARALLPIVGGAFPSLITARACVQVHGIGEQHFSDLVPWLMATLRSDQSSVERSGAAQVRAWSAPP